MSNSHVWLNGKELGGRPYGYIGFSFDLTPHLRFGGEGNVLAVRLAPEDQSSRWYPGAGIYRNVWLTVTGPVHVARWGTYITTPEVTDSKATVSIKTEIQNQGSQTSHVTLETAVVEATGKRVSRVVTDLTVPAGAKQGGEQRLEIADPQRWDIAHPYLYTAFSTVRDGTRVLDRYTTSFGVRTIEFDLRKGFLLNGRHLKLQGVCNHHDLGALGAAVNRRATERQLQIMKSMGVNAIRTSHNPPSPELLEFCDRLGLLVMDEAFDMWGMVKVRNGHGKYFSEWGETDLRDMIRRDRNHPSIILYSIGNEIREQGSPEGWKVAKRLTEICHEEDRTRPVTAGFNDAAVAIRNGLADQVDIPGFNYKPTQYEQILKDHPKWIIVGSETASCVSSRGVYHLPIEKYQKHTSLQLTSYDVISPPWAYLPDAEFDAQEKNPSVLGEFVWTGFDYLGEPTPYFQGRGGSSENDWPSRSSYFGIVDLAGFPKDRYYLYKSVWTSDPMVHVLPHWNWTGYEGRKIPVMAYTNCDEVELFLNGKSLGRKKHWSEPVELPVGPNVSKDGRFASKYRLLWEVSYEPGTLKAVAYKHGAQAVSDEVRTAGPAAKIALIPDRARVIADGEDLSFVTVRIEDKDGNPCPLADNLVRFKVEGAGSLAAVDNGNAATVEPFQADYRKAFNGLCLLIVRSERGQTGRIHISASSEGLKSAETTVTAANR
jgi:beta-galactosidase